MNASFIYMQTVETDQCECAVYTRVNS